MIVRADALHLPLRDASVDLIVTSPPYFALRSYRDGGEHYDGQIGSEATPAAFVGALVEATREMVRVLKPAGSIFVNLGDKYAGSGGHNNAAIGGAGRGPSSYNKARGGTPTKSLMGLPWRYALACVDQLGLILRAEIIWSKPNGLPESVTDRVRRSHEQWFHMVKSPRYYAAVDEVREAYEVPNHAQIGKENRSHRDNDTGLGVKPWHMDVRTVNPLGKLPGSVWTVPSEPLIVPEHLGLPDHFAAFPQEWPRRIILGWSPTGICTVCGEGRRPVVDREHTNDRGGRQFNVLEVDPSKTTSRLGWESQTTITGYACACPDTSAPTRPAVVLDPFGGTGTVVMVARTLGRTGINVDLSSDYCRLARWRIYRSGHAAKTEERTWRDAQGVML